MVRILKVALSAILVMVVAGCSVFPFKAMLGSTRQQAIAQGEAVLNHAASVSLHGVVDWPMPDSKNPRVQALATNVVSQATIAMIDESSGYTVATTLSDDNGNFTLNIPNFAPVASPDAYTIEAVKGASSQGPGASTLRLRTVAQWTGSGWVSCTNAAVGGTVAINGMTTALALEVGLTRAAASEVIGATDNNNPPDLLKNPLSQTGYPTISGSEIFALETDVNDYILDNLDPVSNTSQIIPTVSSLNPTAGIVGQVVDLKGTGFVAVPGATTVKFNGVTAPIVAVTPTDVFCTVPDNALTGNVTVTTPLGTDTQTNTFTIPNSSTVVITTFAPNPSSVGTTLSIGGQGFTTPANTNTVTFTCTPGTTLYGQTCPGTGLYSTTPISGDAHSIGVVIPLVAVSGPVQVSNTNGSSSNVYLSVSLTGTPYINDTFPTKGVANQDMEIEGLLFGKTPGTVDFTDSSGKTYAATIRQWRDGQIRVTVPWQTGNAPGPATITVTNSSNLSAKISWTVLAGNLQYGSPIYVGSLTSQTGPDILPVFSGHAIYLAGGGGSPGTNVISELTLNSDGSPLALTSNVWTMTSGLQVGGPDAHLNKNTWQGDRYWLFDEAGTTGKGYMQFDQMGNFLGTTAIIGPAFSIVNGSTFFQHDTAIAGGNKGVYMFGADETTTTVESNLVWELYNSAVDSIGPWQEMGMFDHMEDAEDIVLGNNLWIFGGAASTNGGPVGISASSPIDQNGNPTGVVNWGSTPQMGAGACVGGNCPGGEYCWMEPIGNNWYGQAWDNAALFEDPLVSGTYPRDFSSTTITSNTLPSSTTSGWASASIGTANCDNTSIVVGAYLYVIGDWGCAGNGNIYAFLIN